MGREPRPSHRGAISGRVPDGTAAPLPRRRPRDSQRSRVYRAETPLPGLRLADLDACAGYAAGVAASPWWSARFPHLHPGRLPRFRPGRGARQAFYREEEHPGGTVATITLPRRYRTAGVVLHEMAHWALAEATDLPQHGRTFARLLLDASTEFLGADAGEALAASYKGEKVRVARPPRRGPDGRYQYGWDERLRLGRDRPLRVSFTPPGGRPSEVHGVLTGRERGSSVLVLRAGHDRSTGTVRVPVTAVWRVLPG